LHDELNFFDFWLGNRKMMNQENPIVQRPIPSSKEAFGRWKSHKGALNMFSVTKQMNKSSMTVGRILKAPQ